RMDKGFYEAISTLEIENVFAYHDKTHIDSCGFGPFSVLSSLLAPDVRSTLVHYDSSGKQSGDYGNSVGYIAAAFSGPHSSTQASAALPRSDMKTLHKLAVDALDRGVRARKPLDYDALKKSVTLDAALEAKGAAFVTLDEHGELRGCIGTL